MTVGQAWRRVRTDPRWKKKLALTAAVGLIPYAGAFFVMGYGLDYMRAVAWGTDGGRLPEWSAFSEHGKRGLYAFVVSLVYGLPLIAAAIVLEIPLFAVLAALSARRGPSGLGVGLAIGAFTLLFMLLAYAYMPVSYSGLLEYAMFDRLDAAWRFRVVLARMRANARPLTGVVLRVIALGLGVLLVTFGVVGGFVALMLLPAMGDRDLAPLALAVVPFGYMLLILVSIALGAVVNLVTYAMLGAYAREAYALPVRAA